MILEAIPLPVVHVQMLIADPGEEWRCDVQFGPDPNDPWVTVTSAKLPRVPRPGDILLVIPPQVTGFYEEIELTPAAKVGG